MAGTSFDPENMMGDEIGNTLRNYRSPGAVLDNAAATGTPVPTGPAPQGFNPRVEGYNVPMKQPDGFFSTMMQGLVPPIAPPSPNSTGPAAAFSGLGGMLPASQARQSAQENAARGNPSPQPRALPLGGGYAPGGLHPSVLSSLGVLGPAVDFIYRHSAATAGQQEQPPQAAPQPQQAGLGYTRGLVRPGVSGEFIKPYNQPYESRMTSPGSYLGRDNAFTTSQTHMGGLSPQDALAYNAAVASGARFDDREHNLAITALGQQGQAATQARMAAKTDRQKMAYDASLRAQPDYLRIRQAAQKAVGLKPDPDAPVTTGGLSGGYPFPIGGPNKKSAKEQEAAQKDLAELSMKIKKMESEGEDVPDEVKVLWNTLSTKAGVAAPQSGGLSGGQTAKSNAPALPPPQEGEKANGYTFKGGKWIKD